MNRRNYYRILHVQPEAPFEVIKSSYKTLMQKLQMHPDLGGDEMNAALINEAYSVLRNTEKRARYDKQRKTVSRSRQRETKMESQATTHQQSSSNKNKCPFCNTPYLDDHRINEDSQCIICLSPLYPIQKSQRDGTSQRATVRIAKQGIVQVCTQWPRPPKYVELRDLSHSGIQFVGTTRFTRGQTIKIYGEQLTAIATIADCRAQSNGQYVIGAQFLTLQFQQSQGTFVSYSA